MKNENTKKLKQEKYRTEEQETIIRFVRVLLIVIIFILLVYFATRIFVKKDLVKDNKETSVTEVSYRKMVFGTLLNRPYDEYYAVAYSGTDNKAYYYTSIVDNYAKGSKSLYVYFIDLDDYMNKDYIAVDGKTNKHAKTISELKVGDLTLLKIKNGEIVKYLENIDDIRNEFAIK